MPVIRFIEGGPRQLDGAHAEISGHENPDYLAFAQAKLAEHAIYYFSPKEASGHVSSTEHAGKTATEYAKEMQDLSSIVYGMATINRERISTAALSNIANIVTNTDDSGIVFVDANNQRFGFDGTLDTEKIDFNFAISDVLASIDDPHYKQSVEIARLVAKYGYDTNGRTIQPGKTVAHDHHIAGNLTTHVSLGRTNEAGEYTPFVTVLTKPPKSESSIPEYPPS